jgi:hypothetical protein
MAQWAYYGKKKTHIYCDTLNEKDGEMGLLTPEFRSYSDIISAHFIPKHGTISVVELSGEHPGNVDDEIKSVLASVYGKNWQSKLDAEMPMSEFENCETSLLHMPHAKYYLKRALDDCGKGDAIRIEALLSALDKEPICTNNLYGACVKTEQEKAKQMELYLQMVRSGAIKERCKPNSGQYSDYVIGHLENGIIIKGEDARKVTEDMAEETGFTVDFIREKAHFLFITGRTDFVYGARNECNLALQAYSDNMEKKIADLMWLAKADRKSLLKSLRKAEKELLKRKGFIYHPMFYMPATETQFGKHKKRAGFGPMKKEKVSFKSKRVRGRVPQVEKFICRSTIKKFFLRMWLRIRSAAKAFAIVSFWYYKHWKFLVALLVATYFVGSHYGDIAGFSLLGAFLLLPTLFFYFIEMKSCYIYKDVRRTALNRKVRAAIFGLDPGVRKFTFNDVKRGTVAINEPIIIEGDVYLNPKKDHDNVIDFCDVQTKKHITNIWQHALFDLAPARTGMRHVVLFGMCRRDASGIWIELRRPYRKSIYYSEEKRLIL